MYYEVKIQNEAARIVTRANNSYLSKLKLYTPSAYFICWGYKNEAKNVEKILRPQAKCL